MTEQQSGRTDKVRYAETHMRLESIGQTPMQAHVDHPPGKMVGAEDTAQAADAPADDGARPMESAKVDATPQDSWGQTALQIDNYAEQRQAREHRPELQNTAVTTSARQNAEIRDETTPAAKDEPLEVPKRPEWIMEETAERTAAPAKAGNGESAEIRRLASGISGAEAIVERAHMPETTRGPDGGWQPEQPATKPQKAAQLKNSTRGEMPTSAPEVAQQDMKTIWPFGRHTLHERLDAEDAELMANRRRAREMRIDRRR